MLYTSIYEKEISSDEEFINLLKEDFKEIYENKKVVEILNAISVSYTHLLSVSDENRENACQRQYNYKLSEQRNHKRLDACLLYTSRCV